MRSSASSALSMPLALSAARSFLELGASRPERSRPRDFLGAALLPLAGLEGREASSSARRASFSAFLRAASAALEAAASLWSVSNVMLNARDQDARFAAIFRARCPLLTLGLRLLRVLARLLLRRSFGLLCVASRFLAVLACSLLARHGRWSKGLLGCSLPWIEEYE